MLWTLVCAILWCGVDAQAQERTRIEGRVEVGDGTLSTGEFRDDFHFYAAKGSRIVVHLQTEDFDPWFILTRLKEGKAAEAPWGDRGIEHTAEDSSEWYVLISTSQVGREGDYKLWVSVDGEKVEITEAGQTGPSKSLSYADDGGEPETRYGPGASKSAPEPAVATAPVPTAAPPPVPTRPDPTPFGLELDTILQSFAKGFSDTRGEYDEDDRRWATSLRLDGTTDPYLARDMLAVEYSFIAPIGRFQTEEEAVGARDAYAKRIREAVLASCDLASGELARDDGTTMLYWLPRGVDGPMARAVVQLDLVEQRACWLVVFRVKPNPPPP